MIIKSDWHIHSEYSYDARLPLEKILEKSKELGFKNVGITDHVNLNDNKFLSDLRNSAQHVNEFRKNHPEMILGAELTPIEKPEFDYIKIHGVRDGYVAPIIDKPFEIELPQTKQELIDLGLRYAVGATHWRLDLPKAIFLPVDKDAMIKEWYRQQLWLACDERVTILGHPWYNGQGVWYDDFSAIPRSMNMEIASALKENKKYVEFNGGVLSDKKMSDKCRRQYTEFIRELFEMGIPVTYGSDSHNEYAIDIADTEKLLAEAGFKEGDISEVKEEDLW